MKVSHKDYTRRHFIKQSTLTSIALISLVNCTNRKRKSEAVPNNGMAKLELKPDPKGYLDLPEGFSYKVISKSGEKMSDGLLVPGRPDGMGAFLAADGKIVIIRNHENSATDLEHSPFGPANEMLPDIDLDRLYDSGSGTNPGLGGTTTLIYDEDTGVVVDEFLSLGGTYRNCAGGVSPWGTWITCEEDVTKADGKQILEDHGYVFEVSMNAKEMVEPKPVKAMGRFNHEAVAVDPDSGCVYLTEDRHDGLIYRFIPKEKENLLAGGELQALAVRDNQSLDTRNWESPTVPKNNPMEVFWIDLDDVESPEDDLRYRGFDLGAARFARGEGIWMGDGELFFACTNGGPDNFGQVFKYSLSPKEGLEGENEAPASLELYAESNDKTVLHMCDNLFIAPWGDVLLCEDNGELNHIRGIDKDGKIYTLARNQSSKSELTGLVFSPSGKTLFVNVQENGDTVAITGPWERFGKSEVRI
ncbi:alkaline phosphatase PhoX [Flagellimonas myxillae]|uniref:alkaline phosphatase PhoX n=1 Tax=Flagellimonas myxillae TaxID=2942214 RepID=UPI00201F6B5F|nr:alkaline phosphatase PhoX [Muricauda myxillae]MCL6267051.1 PhoX family protein [Muricauda myxillae]